MADALSQSAADAASGMADWRALVEKALKGRDFGVLRSETRDGVVIEPLYARRRNAEPLPWRGTPRWAIVQAIDDPDPERANAQARDDLAGGATGLALRFADAPTGGGLGLPTTNGALRAALDGVDPAAVHLRLEPHPAAFRSVVWLSNFILASGVAPERAQVSFGLDPLSMGAAESDLDPMQFAGTLSYLRDAHFRGPFACCDSRVLHEAGASEAQELAGVLASAAWWLRALAEAGTSATDALSFLSASIAVDRDVLLSIAKLRALQLLWARLGELCDAPAAPLRVHAETSRRMLTRSDPPTNLLRNTVAAFAACAGGADSIAVVPHTAALGIPDRGARALARNIQHLLLEEAHLHVVADPAAGSGALEALTDALCEHAWAEFQAIEREGGIVESLRTGGFQARIAKARAALVEAVASGTAPLVGVTIHPPADEGAVAAKTARPVALAGLAPINLETAVEAAA